jgi:glycosyltransferase involved in cell wall biosynthesis
MNPLRVSDPKIKILRVIARLNIGGPAIHVVLLSAGMDRVRFESLLVSGNENPGGGSMLDYALSHGVQPAIIPEIVGEFSLGPRELRALVRLYRLMRQERPHVVHTHTAKAGFVGRLAARLARVPVVVHTFHGHVLHGYYGPRKTQLLRRMERGLACLTDCIITVSEQVKRDLVTYGVATADRIEVISLGLELDPFLESGPYEERFAVNCSSMGLNG